MKLRSVLKIATYLFAILPFFSSSNSSNCTYAGSINLGQAANFVVLGLENGTVIINSATSITGDVGYSDGVVSNTNQKVDSFVGTAYVHSGATFNHTMATYDPSGGIQTGPGVVDDLLDQANADALAASAAAAALGPPTHVLGELGDNDNVVVNSVGTMNIVSLTSLDYKEDVFEISGGPNDFFFINVSGNFEMDNSQIVLSGVAPSHVLWNFPNASTIDINKEGNVFRGTILAPVGSVEYHNPATFEGAIIAKDIDLHSDFNITHVGFVPEPSSLVLVIFGVATSLGLRQRCIRS